MDAGAREHRPPDDRPFTGAWPALRAAGKNVADLARGRWEEQRISQHLNVAQLVLFVIAAKPAVLLEDVEPGATTRWSSSTTTPKTRPKRSSTRSAPATRGCAATTSANQFIRILVRHRYNDTTNAYRREVIETIRPLSLPLHHPLRLARDDAQSGDYRVSGTANGLRLGRRTPPG